jgi:hypothetical protein
MAAYANTTVKISFNFIAIKFKGGKNNKRSYAVKSAAVTIENINKG